MSLCDLRVYRLPSAPGGGGWSAVGGCPNAAAAPHRFDRAVSTRRLLNEQQVLIAMGGAAILKAPTSIGACSNICTAIAVGAHVPMEAGTQ